MPLCSLALIGTLFLAGCGGQASTSTSHSPRPVTSHGGTTFTGTVTKDTCANPTTRAPVGDVGCGITVDDNTVEIVHGNILYPAGWGTVRGFAPLGNDIVGRTVKVYARYIGPRSYDLAGPDYFVQLVS